MQTPSEGLDDVIDVVAATNHVAMRKADGRLVHWGATENGIPIDTPVELTVPSANVTAVAVGSEHTLALTVEGVLHCFGGDDVAGQCDIPAAVQATQGWNRSVRAVRASYRNSYVRLANGTWAAFGENTGSFFPERLNGERGGAVTGMVVINSVTLVTFAGGGKALECWQADDAPLPELLRPPFQALSLGALPAAPIPRVLQFCTLLSPSRGVAALLANGTVLVWPRSGRDVTDLLPPADLPPDVTAIACGRDHILALMANGSVRSWGANTVHGQTDVPLNGALSTKAIAAGVYHSMFLGRNGNVYQTGVVTGEATDALPATLQLGSSSSSSSAINVTAGSSCAAALLVRLLERSGLLLIRFQALGEACSACPL
jgi:hypothetical protein